MTKLSIELHRLLKRDRYSERAFALEVGLTPPHLNMVLNKQQNLTMMVARAIYKKYPELAHILLEEETE